MPLFWLISSALAGAAQHGPAHFSLPGRQAHIEVPARTATGEWEAGSEGDGGATFVEIGRPFGLTPRFYVNLEESLQPDFETVPPDVFLEDLRRRAGHEGGGLPEGFSGYEPTLLDVPPFGRLLSASAVFTPRGNRGPLDYRELAVPVRKGLVRISGASLAGRGKLDAAILEVAAMIHVDAPARTAAELGYGAFVADAGYGLTLPSLWRSLTEDEYGVDGDELLKRGFAATRRAAQSFFDGRTALAEEPRTFDCVVNAEPDGTMVEVVDPAADPEFVDFYKVRTRSRLQHTTYTTLSGSTTTKVVWTSPDTSVRLTSLDDGGPEPTILQFGDRDGYAWTLTGKVTTPTSETAYTVHTVFLSFGEYALDCTAYAPTDDTETLPSFDAAMQTLHVLDPEAHPAHTTLVGWYRTRWPWHHPALQAWWLAAVLFVGIGVWAARSD